MATKEKKAINKAAATMGKKGGLRGGVSRWSGVSAEERTKITRAAAQARWSKDRPAKNGSKCTD